MYLPLLSVWSGDNESTVFSDKESVVFRDFGGNDYDTDWDLSQWKCNDRLQQAVSLIICASESDNYGFSPDS